MVAYRIIRHVPGHIKLEVPLKKNLSISELFKMSKILSTIAIPEGIKDIRPNPLSGSIVITYEQGKIDIIEYIKNIASNMEIQKFDREKNNKKNRVKCPYLIRWLTATCKAADKPYNPSQFQIQQYCTSKDYKKCPFLFKTVHICPI